MSSLKRKRAQVDASDSEDEPSYGKQILPVANLPDDFNDEPTDGMQYLFMVRRAARQLPATVRVPNPYEQHIGPVLPTPVIVSSPVEVHLPSEQWRETFEYHFQNFRKNFNQTTVHVGTANPGPRNLMPDKKDRDLWWAFLSGKPESEWNPLKKGKTKPKKRSPPAAQAMRAWMDEAPHNDSQVLPYTSYNDDIDAVQVLPIDPAETLPSPIGTPVPVDYIESLARPSSGGIHLSSALTDTDVSLIPREPTTVLLKLIDERMALHLLMYFTHWINLFLKSPESRAYFPTECHARWIFCLLSRIDDFISPDDLHLLRNLVRACVSLLKYTKARALHRNPHDIQANFFKQMSEASSWIIITTIVGVWKQRDLWIDAEDSLRKVQSFSVSSIS